MKALRKASDCTEAGVAHPANHRQEERCDDGRAVVARSQLCNLLRGISIARSQQGRRSRAPAHRLADRRLPVRMP